MYCRRPQTLQSHRLPNDGHVANLSRLSKLVANPIQSSVNRKWHAAVTGALVWVGLGVYAWWALPAAAEDAPTLPMIECRLDTRCINLHSRRCEPCACRSTGASQGRIGRPQGRWPGTQPAQHGGAVILLAADRARARCRFTYRSTPRFHASTQSRIVLLDQRAPDTPVCSPARIRGLQEPAIHSARASDVECLAK